MESSRVILSNAVLQAVSDCGDLAVLLPLAVLLAGMLWRRQSARAGLTLIGSLLACLGAILLLKLLFLSCGRLWWPAMRSPSGHAGASTFVYGALLTVHGARARGISAGLSRSVLVLLIVAIAASRVLLGYHTLPEVLLGSAAGGLAWAGFARAWSVLPCPRPIDVRVLALALVLVLLVFHQQRLPAEHWIGRVAGELSCRP